MYEPLHHGATSAVSIDSSAIVAHFHSRDHHRDVVRAFFRGLRDGAIRARPLYTSEYVMDESTTTLPARAGHDRAAQSLEFLRDSSQIRVLHVDPETHETACEQFAECDDHDASFTDHILGIQAHKKSVEYVLSFDQDFERFGLTTLPSDGD